jgi:hypothetical protein
MFSVRIEVSEMSVAQVNTLMASVISEGVLGKWEWSSSVWALNTCRVCWILLFLFIWDGMIDFAQRGWGKPRTLSMPCQTLYFWCNLLGRISIQVLQRFLSKPRKNPSQGFMDQTHHLPNMKSGGRNATRRKVAGSIPFEVIGFFNWHIPSRRTMALALTQPLTEMSTRNLPVG